MFKMKNVLAISVVLLLTACSSDNDSPGFESTDPRVPETSMLNNEKAASLSIRLSGFFIH